MIINALTNSLLLILAAVFLFTEKTGALLGELEYDGRVNIRLEHSFDHSPNPQYTHRGDIAIKSLHTGLAFIEQVPLTSEDIKSLKKLARRDGNYRLRATVKTTDDKQYTFLTFVKACSLLECHLSDVISINLDHGGNVIAVTMAAPAICTGSYVDDVRLTQFNTSVFVRHMELGPIPDTASYIQKLDKEREAKERGETKDNRSFLGKYWMYILPVVIFMLLPSATNQDGGGTR